MAMMPEGGGRSLLGLVLQAHPSEAAEVELPPSSRGRFSVARPVLLLPGGVRVMVDAGAPFDAAARWWDSVTVAGTAASLWYSTPHHNWPGGGRHRRDGGR